MTRRAGSAALSAPRRLSAARNTCGEPRRTYLDEKDRRPRRVHRVECDDGGGHGHRFAEDPPARNPVEQLHDEGQGRPVGEAEAEARSRVDRTYLSTKSVSGSMRTC